MASQLSRKIHLCLQQTEFFYSNLEMMSDKGIELSDKKTKKNRFPKMLVETTTNS